MSFLSQFYLLVCRVPWKEATFFKSWGAMALSPLKLLAPWSALIEKDIFLFRCDFSKDLSVYEKLKYKCWPLSFYRKTGSLGNFLHLDYSDVCVTWLWGVQASLAGRVEGDWTVNYLWSCKFPVRIWSRPQLQAPHQYVSSI